MTKDYQLGYSDALKDASEYVTRLIRANGGAETPLQMLNVFNGLIYYLQDKRIEVRQSLAECEVGDESCAMEEFFGEFEKATGIKLVFGNTKGGR
jgi:hypothetical protein